MLRRKFGFAVGSLLLATSTAWAAPLFPDVKDEHWAKDAVAKLAAQGLLEGYPDGTFKGDRAATRWEVAMIVARLLAKMEQAHATFATKAELDEVRKLANALKEELDALGVRVTNLEESVDRLDKRVTELERITFYGYVDTRATSITLQNNGGLGAMTSLPNGIQLVDYNAAIGGSVGAGGALPGVSGFNLPPTFNPFATGVLTTMNWRTGRPLVNGVGFTTRAVLGLRINVSDDIDAGAEFSAFTSQGNQILDAYYGANPPYQSSPFTGISAANSGLNGLNNSPYSRMNLDHFWVKHRPTNTKLVLGSFTNHSFDHIVFAGQVNLNEFGPEYLPNFGFQLTGEHAFDEEEHTKLYWEVMGTRLPDGSLGAPTQAGNSYYSTAYGANVKLNFHDEKGHVKLNYLRMSQNQLNDGARLQGLTFVPNLGLNWVNPNGFFVNQPGVTAGQIGGTNSNRPIVGVNFPGGQADGSVAAAVASGLLTVPATGIPNVGGFGPQDQTTYGASASYKWDESEYEPRVYAEYAHSDYKPQTNSSYSVGGNAYRFGGGAFMLDKQIEIDLHYLRVDPTFDPFIIQTPAVGGLANVMFHTPDFYYVNNLSPTHGVKEYPHNREGIRAKVLWKFRPTGRLTVEYGNLNQTRTSLQDVRFSANSLAPGTPNTNVLGYSPGFIETLFSAYHPGTFAAAGGNNFAVPLEDPRGSVENLYVSAGHKWLFDEENSNRGVLLSGGVKTVHFFRNSNMASIRPGAVGLAAENQNHVDLGFTGWHIGVDYDVTDDFTAKVGYTQVDIYGHFDPLGVNNAFAVAAGTARYRNLDIQQRWPDLGFDWKIDDNVSWNLEGRYYMFDDKVPSHVFTTPNLPNLNINAGAVTAHPFNWSGFQINTQFLVKF
jgi:hypothetical protein